jgi:hypothetical protein
VGVPVGVLTIRILTTRFDPIKTLLRGVEGGETGLFSTYRTQVVPAVKLFSATAVAFTHYV